MEFRFGDLNQLAADRGDEGRSEPEEAPVGANGKEGVVGDGEVARDQIEASRWPELESGRRGEPLTGRERIGVRLDCRFPLSARPDL